MKSLYKRLFLPKPIVSLIVFFLVFCLFSWDNFCDINAQRAKLDAEWKADIAKLDSKGGASTGEYKAIDTKYKIEARKLEAKSNRRAAMEEIFKKAGVEMPEFTGTDPSKGRGVFGDIDTDNLKPGDAEKIIEVVRKGNEVARKAGKPTYDITVENGYIRIDNLDANTFKSPLDNPLTRKNDAFARAMDAETVTAYAVDAETGKIIYDGQGKPIVTNNDLYNRDCLKKMVKDFDGLKSGSGGDIQSVAKNTERIIKNTYGENLERFKGSPKEKAALKKLVNQCEYIKKGGSHQGAGVRGDDALKNFVDQIDKTVVEANKITREAEARQQQKIQENIDKRAKITSEIEEKLKTTTDTAERTKLENDLAKTKERMSSAQDRLEKRQTQLAAADEALFKKGGDKILAEIDPKKKIALDLEVNTRFKSQPGSPETYKAPPRRVALDIGPASRQDIEIYTGIRPGEKIGFFSDVCRIPPSVAGGVNIIDGVIGGIALYDALDNVIDPGMIKNPNTRKAAKFAVATTVSAGGILEVFIKNNPALTKFNVVAGGVQSAIAGYNTGLDEMTQWYIDNPGKDYKPFSNEALKIGMRAGGKFAYGFVTKPYQDIKNVVFAYKEYEQDAEYAEACEAQAQAMRQAVKEITIERLKSLDDFFDNAEKTVNSILKMPDITQAEENTSKKILEKVEYGRKFVITSRMKTEGEPVGTLDNRVRSFNTAKDTAEEIKKLLNDLIKSIDLCALAIKVTDAQTGKDITKTAQVHLYGQPDIKGKTLEKGLVVYKELVSGEYKIDVDADGYYPVKEQALTIDRSKLRDYTGTIKLEVFEGKVDYTAKPSEETKKIDENIRKQAKNIKDPELEKAKSVLNNFNSMARTGIIFSRKAILEQRDSSGYSNSVARYAGIEKTPGGEAAKLLVASGSVQPFVRKGAELCAANILCVFAEYLKDCRINSWDQAPMKKALEEPNEASGTKDAAYSLALAKFHVEYMENQAFNVSNVRWFKAYKEYQDNQKAAPVTQGDEKKSDRRDAEYWLGVISSGGYKAVSAELDKIWSQDIKKDLGVKDDKNFKSENPYIVKDYRNKYIAGTIAPLIFEFAKANKLEREKEFVVVLNDFANTLNSCTVTVRGSINAGPESAPFKTIISCGKKKDEKSGAGSFSVSYNLKDMESTGIGIDIKFETPKDYIVSGYSSRGGVSLDFDKERIFYDLRVSGSNIEIVIEPYLYYVVKRVQSVNTNGSNSLIKTPQISTESASKAASEAAQASGSADSLGLRKADYLYNFKKYVSDGALSNISSEYYNAEKIIRHNRDITLRGVQDEAQKRALNREVDAKIKELNDAREKINKSVKDSLKNSGEKLEAIKKDLNKQESDITKQQSDFRKSNEQERKAYNETKSDFEKVFGNFISNMNSLHRSRDENANFDYSNPEFINSEYNEKAIKEFLTKSSEITSLQNKMRSFESDLGSQYDASLRRFQDMQKVKTKLYGPKCFDISGQQIYYQPWLFSLYDTLRDYEIAAFIAKLNLLGFVSENTQRAQWYLNKRGEGIKNLDAMIAEAETLSNQLPNDSKIAEADGMIAPVAGKVEDYSMSIVRAVMSESAKDMKIPAGILNSKGSDETFVKECAAIMERLKSSCGGVVGDMLPPGMNFETAFSKLQDIYYKLQWSELTEDQRKKAQAVQDKMKPMWERWSKYKNLQKVWALGIAASLEGWGNTPEERVKKLIEANEKVIAKMQLLRGEASSVSSVEQAQKFIKEALDYYGMMPDIPTAASIMQRCELFQAVVKTGVFERYRASNNLPPAPKTVSIFGKDVPYDGRCVVYKYSQLPAISADLAKAYDNTEWKGKFTKSLFYKFPKNKDYKLEYSMWQGENQFYTYYDQGKDDEMPVSKEYLPMHLNILLKNISDKDNKSSRVKYEPGITILLLP